MSDSSRIFDPNAGDGNAILVYSASADRVVNDYSAEMEHIEHARRLREFGSLMRQTHSFAG